MKILLAGFHPDQIARLREAFAAVEFVGVENGLDVTAARADALIGVTRAAFDKVFTKETMDAATTIRWVHAPGAGIDGYLYAGLESAPFTMTNGKIIQGPEVAEHGVALALALTRRLGQLIRGVPADAIPRPIELMGKTAVVIGLGGIGLGLAERLHAFGMIVEAVTEDSLPILSFVARVSLADQLLEALPRGDLVFMAAPLTAVSRRMLSDREFQTMRKGAYFINISRGLTVDTDALLRHVENGHLAGAGIDVADPEPLPSDHGLRKFDNVIVTPHFAGRSDGLASRNFNLIETNIRRFMAGLAPVNIVDKARGF